MGTTAGATDKFTGNATVGNCTAGTYPGPDLVYAVQPSMAGMLSVTLTATYADSLVHIRTSCPGDDAEEIACDSESSPGAPASVSLQVTGGTTYYVVADSYKNTSGPFTLTLSLQ